jgi:YVTN family beta-propeller protein
MCVLLAQAAPEKHVVCVSNERSGDVTVIDGESQSVVTTILVGKRPRGIHAGPDGRLLFVALSGTPLIEPRQSRSGIAAKLAGIALPADRSADGIAIIDIAAQKVIRKVDSGPDPAQLAVSADGRVLYVANESARTVTVVNHENRVTEAVIPVQGEPEGVVLTPDGKFLYVTCDTSGQVFVIDTKNNTNVTQFTVGGRPKDVAFLPDGCQAFIPSEASGILNLFGCVDRKLVDQIFLPTGSQPAGLVITGDGSRLYVSTGPPGVVCVFDPGTVRLVDTIKVGEHPGGLALSQDERLLYAANAASNDLSVVNLQTCKEVARVKVGEGPWGVAVVERRNETALASGPQSKNSEDSPPLAR